MTEHARPTQIHSNDLPKWRRYLFLIHRRPTLNFGEQRLPDRIKNPKGWASYIDTYTNRGGLVSFRHLKEFNISETSILHQDLTNLNTYLMNDLIQHGYESRRRQNQYWMYQWLFLGMAFISTAFATFATKINTGSIPVGDRVITVAQIFAFLTTASGIISSVIAAKARNANAQKYWFSNRRITEQLRKYYYLYLAHVPPFDTAKHVVTLQRVREMVEAGNPVAVSSPSAVGEREKHTPDELKALIQLYIRERVEHQRTYYQDRISEYDYNRRLTFDLGIYIPAIAAILSLISGLIGAPDNNLAILVILLPTVAASFIAFQRIYEWDRQQSLFEDTLRKLDLASIVDPDEQDYYKVLLGLVQGVESVLSAEADQWGQPLADSDAQLTDQQLFDAYVKKLNLSQEQVTRIQGIVDSGKLPSSDTKPAG